MKTIVFEERPNLVDLKKLKFCENFSIASAACGQFVKKISE
jgi:hypothetical protein